jgi:hypothetical protein
MDNPQSNDPYEDGPGTMEQPEKMDKDMDEGGPVATIPRSLLEGHEFKVGEEIMLQIVKLMPEEVLVRYSHVDEDKEGEGGEKAEMPDGMPSGGAGDNPGDMY